MKRLNYDKQKKPLTARIKRGIVIFAVSNLIAFILLPALFYGFWGTIGNITGNVVESRKLYAIERKHGRTVRDLYESVSVWKSLPSAVNPMNWGR